MRWRSRRFRRPSPGTILAECLFEARRVFYLLPYPWRISISNSSASFFCQEKKKKKKRTVSLLLQMKWLSRYSPDLTGEECSKWNWSIFDFQLPKKGQNFIERKKMFVFFLAKQFFFTFLWKMMRFFPWLPSNDRRPLSRKMKRTIIATQAAAISQLKASLLHCD